MNRGALEPKVYPQMAGKPRELWEKGKPLNEAWWTFANEKVKAEYEATFQLSSQDVSDGDDGWTIAAKLLQGVSESLQRPERRENLRQLMRSDLVDWLLHEDFYAYGFRVRRYRDGTPRRIFSEFWENPDINWEKGIASDMDSEFQRIRIIDRRDFSEIELKPKIGRKSHKPLIYQAVNQIIKNNLDFENLSNKEKSELVREFIKRENPELDPFNGKGFRDDAMRKNINSCLKERNNK